MKGSECMSSFPTASGRHKLSKKPSATEQTVGSDLENREGHYGVTGRIPSRSAKKESENQRAMQQIDVELFLPYPVSSNRVIPQTLRP